MWTKGALIICAATLSSCSAVTSGVTDQGLGLSDLAGSTAPIEWVQLAHIRVPAQLGPLSLTQCTIDSAQEADRVNYDDQVWYKRAYYVNADFVDASECSQEVAAVYATDFPDESIAKEKYDAWFASSGSEVQPGVRCTEGMCAALAGTTLWGANAYDIEQGLLNADDLGSLLAITIRGN